MTTAQRDAAIAVLDADELRDAPGLYVHVPFCEAKCSYCDFYSVARGDVPAHRYADALECEAMRAVPPDFAPATVFIGGGTPTALTDADFERVLAIVAARAHSSGRLREWSVECNPNSLSPQKARIMLDAGVTRVSIGVQSFDENILRSVGRVHTSAEARAAVELARATGFRDVSIDLLFALPGQGLATFQNDLDKAIELGTDHVSAYALLYEPGTAITRRLDAGLVASEDEDIELSMLRLAETRLGAAGFERYEISNFARPGHTCRHNQSTWRNREYIGIGPSAASCLRRVRRRNVSDWRAWQTRVLDGDDPTDETDETLSPPRAAAEELMLRLRTLVGAPLALVAQRHRVDVEAVFGADIARFEAAGLLTRRTEATGPWLAFTARGLEVADGILAELLDVAAR